jgi:hypothetical protein
MTTPLRRALLNRKGWLQTLLALAAIWVVGWFLTGTVTGAFTILALVTLFGICGAFYT